MGQNRKLKVESLESRMLLAASIFRSELIPFQAAGAPGDDGVLEEGATFAPTSANRTTTIVQDDWFIFNIHTSGLPAGAYTAWIIAFPDPESCSSPVDEAGSLCGPGDIFNGSQDGGGGVSVFWTDGGIVKRNGLGRFRARVNLGELPDGAGQTIIPGAWGAGTFPLDTGELHGIIKYHGPASDDPDVLYSQTHTFLGACGTNANAVVNPFGVTVCFDPQAALLKPPSSAEAAPLSLEDTVAVSEEQLLRSSASTAEESGDAPTLRIVPLFSAATEEQAGRHDRAVTELVSSPVEPRDRADGELADALVDAIDELMSLV